MVAEKQHKPKRKARDAVRRVVNLDECAARDWCHAAIEAAEGVCEFGITPRADSKTLQQLRYFHGPVVMTLCNFQAAQGEAADPKRWKRWLKKKCLTDPEKWADVDPDTGERTAYVPSLADLTVVEMSEFIDRACAEVWHRIGRNPPAPGKSYPLVDPPRVMRDEVPA